MKSLWLILIRISPNDIFGRTIAIHLIRHGIISIYRSIYLAAMVTGQPVLLVTFIFLVGKSLESCMIPSSWLKSKFLLKSGHFEFIYIFNSIFTRIVRHIFEVNSGLYSYQVVVGIYFWPSDRINRTYNTFISFHRSCHIFFSTYHVFSLLLKEERNDRTVLCFWKMVNRFALTHIYRDTIWLEQY